VGCEARARAAARSKALSLLASMRAFCSSVSSIFARLGPSLAAPSWGFCASELTSFGADGSGISLLVPSPAGGIQGSYCTSTAIQKCVSSVQASPSVLYRAYGLSWMK